MSERWLAGSVALAFLFALHLALRYFSGTLGAGLAASALLAFILLTVSGCGRLLLRSFGVGGMTESEKTLIGATLGLGLLSVGLFLLGLVGGLRPWAVSVLLGAFWVVGFTEMRDLLRSLNANESLLRDQPALAGSVLALLGFLFWLTWVPPHLYDSLVYHLRLADAYVRAGRLVVLPDLLFSHFPQNGEMLFTLGLLFGSDTLAKMFTWLGTFLSLWWLLEMGKRLVAIPIVLLACLLAATHTAVLLLTPTAYVECLVMLWVTASVLSFLRWRAEADEPDFPRGWLALSGIFAGLGVGTKYYAGICPALLGLYLLGRWAHAFLTRGERPESRPAWSRLRDGAVFSLAAAATGAPWLVKNWFFVGNPVFPFFYRIFPTRGVGWDDGTAGRYFEIMTEYGHLQGHWLKDLFQFPYLAASGSTRFGGGADVLGSLGWGLLVAALPLAAWAAWKKRTLRWIAFYCAAHWALWFSTGVVLRFLTVLVPLLSLLAAQGLHQAWSRLGGPARVLLGAAAALMLWTNLGLFLYVHSVFGTFSALTGVQSRQEFLSSKLDYYPCAAFARDRLPENDKILVIGEQRGYHIRQPHTVTTPMSANRFVGIANEAGSPADLARRLKEEGGYGYLLLVPREGQRLGEQYGVFPFSEQGRGNWSALESRGLEAVFSAPGRCTIYRIL
ncbi:MAG: hypothetical protein A2X36_17390 [Elusimicrobia bacterium GWA2_69_24]|nr:MAG: hypothetical protein A2X36_17390 [Elusimicrobia bacterium GWA2_69_24]HBL17909.1 hypothetical protein [Elusimicrobiota bacterium]